MNERDRSRIEGIIASCGPGPDGLIPTLLAIQGRFRYLPREALDLVVASTAVTAADLAGVVSFYPRFRTRPAGEHLIQVCVGTACHVKGAADTSAEFRHLLEIPEGDDTDPQGLFTLEEVACLGCCMLAPAVRIGTHTYGHVDAGRVPDVLADYLSPSRRDEPPVISLRDSGERTRSEAGEARTCLCTSCASAGAEEVARELREQIDELQLPVRLLSVGCTGLSSAAPVVDIALPSGESWRYGRVGPDQVRALLLEHFIPGGAVMRVKTAATELLDRFLDSGGVRDMIRYRLEEGTAGEFSRHGRQVRKSTELAGEIDPLDIDAYIARGGFDALRIAAELSPDGIISRITASGLRGRGGAGYATGIKWQETRRAPGEARYVVCNGDEGDPGAFMDRMILESFPFRVIEGMAIAAAAIGASEGILYIRGEYRRALERLREAVAICTARGCLGTERAGGERPFTLRVFEGAGAYVCGEETALLESMEGRRGMPRIRPPFPSESGLNGLPTLVNNVETFALVPAVIREGAESFASLGTSSSRGTKSFALAGAVARGGLVEVPMGMSLREIVEEIGGGLAGTKALKAIQVGGPSGGCVPAALSDTPVDYEALQGVGAIMGSGGMIVLDEGDCLVDLARYFTAFARRESCGKCGACRIGTVRMLEILEEICRGRGRKSHLDRLEELGRHLQSASLCGLGRSAPNTTLSTLRHFRGEYLAHVAGTCPAGRCKGLITYAVMDHCIGCTRCAQRCPADAIEVDPHQMHRIDEGVCTRCDICRQVCPVAAVEVA